jgi:hypothetical protein
VNVELPVFCALSGQMRVQVQGTSGGQPNGTVLAEQLISPGPLPAIPAFVKIEFSSPAYIQGGTLFALVLSSSGECGVFAGPELDSYAGGDGFAQSLPGNTWGQVYDLPFRTTVNLLSFE